MIMTLIRVKTKKPAIIENQLEAITNKFVPISFRYNARKAKRKMKFVMKNGLLRMFRFSNILVGNILSGLTLSLLSSSPAQYETPKNRYPAIYG